VGGVAAGDPALSEALRSFVIEPVLADFPLEILPVPAAPDARTLKGVRERIAKERLVIAEVSNASAEVLLCLARRGPADGLTVVLVPGRPSSARGEVGVVRYPLTAAAVQAGADGLAERLRAALMAGREEAAADARRLRVDSVGDGRLARLRQIEARTVPLRAPDPTLQELCRAYGALGEWADVVRLVDALADERGALDDTALGKDLLWVYAVALNRCERGEDAERILRRRLESADADTELCSALGRVYKDRWDSGGRKVRSRKIKAFAIRAIAAYRDGFDVEQDYYPGINALMLMVDAKHDPRRLRALIDAIRTSLARGRNPDEHPWWYCATRVQLEVIAGLVAGMGDFAAAYEALDTLLAQPSEEWMRQSTALDLGRIIGRWNADNPTGEDQVEDSPEVRSLLDIRNAVLSDSRTGPRDVPPHCVLEATRRGGDRWINFTNSEPRPLFCRARGDTDADSVLPGDPVGHLLGSADEEWRRTLIGDIGRQLSEGFGLTESSLVDLVQRDVEQGGGNYLVLQVDEATAIEPWELLAQETGGILSLECSFARRLWLSSQIVRRRSPERTRRALVVGNPTGDLPESEKEARDVAAQLWDSTLFHDVPTLIGREQATLMEFREALTGGGIDLLHYAGHAQGGAAAGLRLADGELEPHHLAGWGVSPAVIVANACSSGEASAPSPETPRQAAYRPSFVTALSAAGVGIYLGCAWPVGDAQAAFFAERFYAQLLGGRPVGHATRDGRIALREKFGEWDPYWAAYVLYGNPWYRFVDETVPDRD